MQSAREGGYATKSVVACAKALWQGTAGDRERGGRMVDFGKWWAKKRQGKGNREAGTGERFPIPDSLFPVGSARATGFEPVTFSSGG
jgi:hypothetical protein